MPNLSKADKAAARKAAAIKAAATRAANKAAKAETAQAAAPIVSDAKPAELTRSARHAALLNAARDAGADQAQLRQRVNVAVSIAGPKAVRKTAPGAPYAARLSSVTAQTQSFTLALRKAYGFDAFDAEPHDAGKLARAYANDLIELASDHATGSRNGLATIVPIAGQALLFRAVDPADDTKA